MEIEISHVTKNDPNTVSAFLCLSRDYFKDMPLERRGKFIQSIIEKLREPDRWLLLLKHKNEYSGFAHFKIDKEERRGWGFILEFYIVPNKRRMGLGRRFFSFITDILRSEGVKDVWLLCNSPVAESFWRSLRFKVTGELDKETGHKIMAKSL
jgi:GNAT superfamily N-acetyltransferase